MWLCTVCDVHCVVLLGVRTVRGVQCAVLFGGFRFFKEKNGKQTPKITMFALLCGSQMMLSLMTPLVVQPNPGSDQGLPLRPRHHRQSGRTDAERNTRQHAVSMSLPVTPELRTLIGAISHFKDLSTPAT